MQMKESCKVVILYLAITLSLTAWSSANSLLWLLRRRLLVQALVLLQAPLLLQLLLLLLLLQLQLLVLVLVLCLRCRLLSEHLLLLQLRRTLFLHLLRAPLSDLMVKVRIMCCSNHRLALVARKLFTNLVAVTTRKHQAPDI